MKDFYKLNEKQLRRNFQKEVLDHNDDAVFMNDEGFRKTMFASFVQDEEAASKLYPGPYKQAVQELDIPLPNDNFEVPNPTPDLSGIRSLDDQYLKRNQQVPETYQPPRGNAPEPYIPVPPDYSVPPLQREYNPEPARPEPNTITQEQIEALRERYPDEAAKMEALIALSPAYRQQGDDGSSPEIVKLYEEYAKNIGAFGIGSATMGVVGRTSINPVPGLRKYYGPQGPVFGQRKAGAPFTGYANEGPYRIGWTKHGNGSVFRFGRPGNHKGIPVPFIRGKSMQPPPKPWERNK